MSEWVGVSGGGISSVCVGCLCSKTLFPLGLSEQSYLHTLDLALLHKNNGPGIKPPSPLHPTPTPFLF